MAIGDVYRLRLVSRQFGQEHNQVLHVQEGGASTMAIAAAALDAWVTSDLRALQDASITYERIVVDSLIPFGPYFERTLTSPAGTKVGDPLPPVNCVVSTWRTALRGKRKRGRNYWGGLITTDVISGQLDAAPLAAWQSAFDNLIVDYAAVGQALIVWSRSTAGLIIPYDPDAAEAITSSVARSVVTSQRRRKIGLGS